MDAEEEEKDVETDDPDVSAESSEALRGRVFLLFGSGFPDLLAILLSSSKDSTYSSSNCLTGNNLRKVIF